MNSLNFSVKTEDFPDESFPVVTVLEVSGYSNVQELNFSEDLTASHKEPESVEFSIKNEIAADESANIKKEFLSDPDKLCSEPNTGRLNDEKPSSSACKFCLKTFKRQCSLIYHEKTHGNVAQKLFECSACNKKFVTQNRLTKHEQQTHSTKTCIDDLQKVNAYRRRKKTIKTCIDKKLLQEYNPPSAIKTKTCLKPRLLKTPKCEEVSPTVKKQFPCNCCGKSFARRHNVIVHQRQNIGKKLLKYVFNNCKTETKPLDVKSATTEKPHLKYCCQSCSFATNVASSFRKHERVHRQQKPFVCSYEACKKRFINEFKLERHEYYHACSDNSPFICSFCNTKCASAAGLKSHERIHTGEKPFSCTVCGKRIGHPGNFSLHMRTHTQDKRHACRVCGKRFVQKAAMKRHERTHTGEKPFECKICGRKFAEKAKCQIHERIHTGERPFVCQYCPSAFSDPTACKRHIRIHTGEKPYSCSYCPKKMSDFSQLRAHEKVHTRTEKPYKCPVCDHRSCSSSALNYHVTTHYRNREMV